MNAWFLEHRDVIKAWLEEHDQMIGWLAASSAIAFVVTLIAVPMLVVRIPEDYFVREHRTPAPALLKGFSPVVRILLLALKNLVGFIFVLAGIAMLLLPGQGLLTILAGIMLLNFPGKYRFERWIATLGFVRHSVDWIRHRAGRGALRFHPRSAPVDSGRAPSDG